jgi:hypothetical protein
MRFSARSFVLAVSASLLSLAIPAAVEAAMTSAVVGSTATMTGDDGATLLHDVLTITQSGGLFRHNRFSGGDPGFASDFDFDSSVPGNQTIDAATGVININARGGDDRITLGDGINLRGTIDGGAGTDLLTYEPYSTGISVNLGLGTTGLSASLGSEQVVPPSISVATGTVTVTNYNIATRRFDISGTVSGILPGDVTGLKILQAPVGTNGPLTIDLTPVATLVPAGDGFTFTVPGGLELPGASEAAFLGGAAYVTVSTTGFPAGVIRGQLFSAGSVALATGRATGTASVTNIEDLVGGQGDDSLVGNTVANVIDGFIGTDWIVGGPGGDDLNGERGTDVLMWNDGDGNDQIAGGDQGGDNDTVQVNGSTADDTFTVSPNGGALRVTRTLPTPVTLIISGTERLIVNGLGGADTFTVNDLGSPGPLATLNLNGFDGSDTFTYVAISSGAITFTAHGGTGSDTLQGPDAPRTWNVTAANQGNIASLVASFRSIEALGGGPGNDTFNVKAFAAGSTSVTGGAGTDTLNYDAESRPVSGDTTPPDGTINSPGVQPVPFFQIETVNITNSSSTPDGAIAIADVTIGEDDASANAVFNVSLGGPSALTVTVNFATANGTATAPGDYTPQTGTVTFAPGETLKTITVPIVADAVPEPSETFFVNLSGAVNATIADAQGQGTITDTDVSRLFMGDRTIAEGRSGTTNAVFTVVLDPPHYATVTVNVATADGTAVAPSDYASVSGPVVFAPGETSRTITVPIVGDMFIEPAETFSVNLSSPSAGATIVDGTGTGVIVNDDAIADDFDGDRKTDLTVFRPASGNWYTLTSSTAFMGSTATAFGLSGDLPVPADYDGDSKTDAAVFRPATGAWIIRYSSTGANVTLAWGLGADAPVPADYDGDGRADVAFYRPSTGVWNVLRSTAGYDPSSPLTYTLGAPTDIPVPGDYDADGKADFAVFRPSAGVWSVLESRTGWSGLSTFAFGLPGDVTVPGDYDGDGVLDRAVYRPSTGEWFALQSTSNGTTVVSRQWGLSGDVPVPGDYDGDTRTDFAVYRPATGEWLVLQSSTNATTFLTIHWGAPGDTPTVHAPGAEAIVISRRTVANSRRTTDLDGDGRGDLTVFRPSTGTWFNLRSGVSYTTAATFQWGLNGDLTVPSDYDGDGVTDLAVWRPADGTWFVRFSGTGFTSSAEFQWGLNGDVPVPGDYDADGKADLAVWRPATGTWHIRLSAFAYAHSISFQWGLSGDVPVPGDYDGDETTDLAVWRPSSGTWFILTSSTNYTASLSFQMGLAGDITVPSDFDGDGKTDLAVYRPSTGTWFIRQSATGSATPVPYQWGLSTDTPVPSDVDGDGKTDLAVYRPSTGEWFFLLSGANFTTSVGYVWGQPGDVPIFRRQ